MYHSLLRNTLASRNLFIRRETIVTQLLFLTRYTKEKEEKEMLFKAILCHVYLQVLPSGRIEGGGLCSNIAHNITTCCKIVGEKSLLYTMKFY